MKLREYQERAVMSLREQYAAGKRAPCLVLPTGGGKTPVAAEIIRLIVAKGLRVGFLANRIELLNQGVSKLAAAGIADVRLIQAENDNQSTSPVFVASVPTLVTPRWQGQLPPADVLILDEVHHLRAPSWERLAGSYANAKLLGLTATPARGDGQGLGTILDSLVVGATVKQLTDLEYLVPARVYAPPRIMDARELAMSPFDAYQQRCIGKRTIVFCSTVEHARLTSDEFNSRGVSSRWLSGESPDRAEILAAFASDDFQVLVNVNVLVEGFDDPGISAAILARRFTHVGSYLQAIGRILRPHPGKQHSVVVDLCGSALVHGTPDLEREYSLDGKGITAARQSIRQCQSCGGVFASDGNCPYCDFAVPPLRRKQARSVNTGVEEVTAQTPRRQWYPKIAAKFPGVCSRCAQRIAVGQEIIFDKSADKGRRARHSLCPLKQGVAA